MELVLWHFFGAYVLFSSISLMFLCTFLQAAQERAEVQTKLYYKQLRN